MRQTEARPRQMHAQGLRGEDPSVSLHLRGHHSGRLSGFCNARVQMGMEVALLSLAGATSRKRVSTGANSRPRSFEASRKVSEAQGLSDPVLYSGGRVHGDPRCPDAGLPAVEPAGRQGLLRGLHVGSL